MDFVTAPMRRTSFAHRHARKLRGGAPAAPASLSAPTRKAVFTSLAALTPIVRDAAARADKHEWQVSEMRQLERKNEQRRMRAMMQRVSAARRARRALPDRGHDFDHHEDIAQA